MPVKFRKMTKRTINKKIGSIINQYRKELEARGIKVKKILLYGSYARGKARKDSDLGYTEEELAQTQKGTFLYDEVLSQCQEF